MKSLRKNILWLVMCLPVVLTAQVSVVSTSPLNNAVNVALSTTVTVTFDVVLDTAAMKAKNEFVFTNAPGGQGGGPDIYFSADGKTMILHPTLAPNTAYFVAPAYVKAMGGGVMSTPFIFYFTTGASFPSASVSGTVSQGSTGVSPQNSIVALTHSDLRKNGGGENGPDFAMMATVNANGTFSIPYVSNGTYFPLAAKDANSDGDISPDNGVDVIALADSVVVNGSSVTGVSLTFFRFTPLTLSAAYHIADSIKATFPGGSVLKRVECYGVDTLGLGRDWEFSYTNPTIQPGFRVRVRDDGTRIDILSQNQDGWITTLMNLPDPTTAASPATVIANTETGGGKTFRNQANPNNYEFEIDVVLGDVNYSSVNNVPHNPSTLYWGVSYQFSYQQNDTTRIMVVQKNFLCNFSTGAVLASTGVDDKAPVVPAVFSLGQNYPNPFNPSTVIPFSVEADGHALLRVYNILGQLVATLFDGPAKAGTVYRRTFDGDRLPTGVYLVRLESGTRSGVKRMIFLK